MFILCNFINIWNFTKHWLVFNWIFFSNWGSSQTHIMLLLLLLHSAWFFSIDYAKDSLISWTTNLSEFHWNRVPVDVSKITTFPCVTSKAIVFFFSLHFSYCLELYIEWNIGTNWAVQSTFNIWFCFLGLTMLAYEDDDISTSHTNNSIVLSDNKRRTNGTQLGHSDE